MILVCLCLRETYVPEDEDLREEWRCSACGWMNETKQCLSNNQL